MIAIPFMSIDPILIEFGIIKIRWYGLAYLVGILLAFQIIRKLNNKMPEPLFSTIALENIITYALVSVVLGGRLGYILFYHPEFIVDNPLQILKIWEGGMSFHGGLVGFILGMYIFSIKYRMNFFAVMDISACVAPIGIFFGRIANYINGELYGNVTSVPWGVVFPHGGNLPRHPSQIYEALTEGIVLFILMLGIYFFTNLKTKSGALSGIFLIGYSCARLYIENYREPDWHLGFVLWNITMGQLLSVPMLIIGLALLLLAVFSKLHK